MSGDVSSYTTWSVGAMNSFGKKYTMHVGAERPDPSGIFWPPHLLPLDSGLFQLLVPQELNPSLLASP
jgi:hypothetical protein